MSCFAIDAHYEAADEACDGGSGSADPRSARRSGRLGEMIQQGVECFELRGKSQQKRKSEEQDEAELREEAVLAEGTIPERGKRLQIGAYL